MALHASVRGVLLIRHTSASALLSQSSGMGSSPSDCCLKHSSNNIPPSVAKSYILQGPESGCMNPAVVIVTKKKVKICFSPARSDIQEIMKKLDKEKQDRKDKKERSQQSGSRSKGQKRQQV
ncbi:PREDICTED: C-C motif chemokine 21 [Chaetura pelagica]|uniref:C-C motif chemokine 21 n=1 Tax=Chaetura pelagica TaxID=8897 RepID=UPI0005239EF4|nr:PREDICTED: C-C motif chemokine 21 [Chaetura pelagica]